MTPWHGTHGKGASREPRTRPARPEPDLTDRTAQLDELRARLTDLPVPPRVATAQAMTRIANASNRSPR